MRYGVFDSGLGGLTVLGELLDLMPYNDYIYFGDVARVPYGTRSNQTIIRYAKEDAAFLIKKGIDAIVIACGTVSAVAHEELRRSFYLPVYSVIDFAVAQAATATRTGRIGVIGTQATINSGIFPKKLEAINQNLQVFQVACPLLVPLIENGISQNDPVALDMASRYLAPLKQQKVDTVIMGCTHYPIYTETFKTVYPYADYINVGRETARRLADGQQHDGKGSVNLYVSEKSQAFSEIASILGGHFKSCDVQVVDITSV